MATSISKIRKIKVVIKKRIEKGARAFFTGANPHSKGVGFSRSLILFSLTEIERLNNKNESNREERI